MASLQSIESIYCSATESFRGKRFMQRKSHPRRPGGSQSGREKRRDATFQARAEEPLGTDSHRTISKQSSKCWLLIGHKKCFVLLCPIGEQFLLSSFREFVHDGYNLATVARFVHQAFLTRQRIAIDESKNVSDAIMNLDMQWLIEIQLQKSSLAFNKVSELE